MNPTKCEINTSQSEALAYGVLGNAATSANSITLYVVGTDKKLLGSVTQTEPNGVSAGGDWSLQAHLLQGFGPPVACCLSVNF